jgi:SNF2 family DNA or RNA helicase
VKLRQYQRDKIAILIGKGRAYLLADVGAGKTVIALTAALELLPKVRPFLIIAPKLVAQTVWHAELNKWTHLHKLSLITVVGPPKVRLRLLSACADIVVINYELVPWYIDNVNKGKYPRGLILDEISRLKTPNKARWRAVKTLADSAEVVWGLTGTPISTSLLDLFGQFRMIDGGQALGRFITHYKQQYFYPIDRMGYQLAVRPGAAQQIYDRIKPLVVRVTSAEQLKAAPHYTNVINVPMGETARDKYVQLHKEFMLELDEGTVIVAETAAVRTGKLSQLTGGGLYDEHDNYQLISEHKYNALDELLLSLGGQPALLVYNYTGEAKIIRKRYSQARWLGREPCANATLIEMWNERSLPNMILLIHVASAGHGLNLQFGGHHLIFFGGTWSQEMYRQTRGRLIRFGQQSPVTVHHLICPRTVDSVQYAVMRGRLTSQDNLVAALS